MEISAVRGEWSECFTVDTNVDFDHGFIKLNCVFNHSDLNIVKVIYVYCKRYVRQCYKIVTQAVIKKIEVWELIILSEVLT